MLPLQTKDNVTVTFQIAVQYAVINEPIATAKAHGAGFGGSQGRRRRNVHC
eukprot:COSAG06_NODE_3205_length_5685_cov_9.491049_4_plen_51_part_00